MSTLSSLFSCQGNPHLHADFHTLLSVVGGHALVTVRDHYEVDREELVAEAVAAAYESYVRLKARGKDPVRDFPTAMATFAVLHVRDDRHVGSACSCTDVLSRKARQKH